MTEVTYHLDLLSGKVELTEFLDEVPKTKDTLKLTHLAEMQLGQRHFNAFKILISGNTLKAESVLFIGGSTRYAHISVYPDPEQQRNHQSA